MTSHAQSPDPFDEPALSTTISAMEHASRIARSIAAGSSGTTCIGTNSPPHASVFIFTTREFVSIFLPRATKALPGICSSSPVGINATRGFAKTGTLTTLPPAMRAATSGVTCSPACAKMSPTCMREPAERVPAKRFDGAASISTCCSSADTFTCSITIAVSKPSGIATPVLANSQFTPRFHADVSGISLPSKSS